MAVGVRRSYFASAAWRYAVAVLATALAVLLRWELGGLFGSSLRFITFFPAVALVALVASGFGPGMLATLLSAMSAVLLFTDLSSKTTAVTAANMGLFIAGGSLMSVVAELVRRSRHREEQARVRQLEEEAQHRHDQALLETERRFRAVVQAVPSLTFEADAEGKNTFASDQWYAYTGLTPETTAGLGWLQAVAPDDADAVRAQWLEAVRTGSPFEVQSRLRGRDGSYRWFLFRAQPARDADGTVIRWAGSLTDIDELIRAEEALQVSEEFNRRLFASSYDCIKVLDLDGNLLSMGERGRRLMEIEDVRPYLNTPYVNFWDEKDRPMIEEALAAARAGGVGQFEGCSASVTGKPRWWDVRVTAIAGLDGRPERLLVVARDMTEAKRAQEALRESEERLRIANEAGSVGIYDADVRTQRTVYSPELCAILGVPPGYVDTPPENGFRFLHPDDRARVEAAVRPAGDSSGNGLCRGELRVLRPSGEIRWVSWSGRTFFEDRPEGRIPVRAIGACIDITERKAAEEALREKEAQFQAFFDNAAVGAAQVDNAGRFAEVNKRLCQITGYAREELLGMSPRDLTLPDEREKDWGQYQRLTAGQAPVYEAEKRYVRKDGQTIWVQVTAGLLREADGRALGTAGIVQEITARKAAEEALRESEEKFRTLAENMRAAVGVVQGTRFVYVNRYMAEMLGYTVDELLGIDFPRLVRDDYRGKMLELAHRRQAGERVPGNYEFPAITKTGQERWVDFWPARASYRGKAAIVGAGFDITERKQMETALRESEEKFRLLAENSKVLIAVVRDRRILYANPCLCELSGYAQEELLAIDIAEMIPPESRELVLDRACRRQRGEALAATYEYRLLDKFGQPHWIQLWPVAINYRGGPAIITAGIDVTERKEIEEALQGRTRSLKLLSEAATRLLRADRTEEVVKEVFRELAEHLEIEVCINYFVSTDPPGLELNFCTGLDESGRKQVEFLRFGQGICGTVAQTGEGIVVQDVQHSADPKTELIRLLQLQAYACFPLAAHGRVLGTFSFGTRCRAHFEEEELHLMRAVADQVALALERQELLNEQRQRADELARANQAKDKFLAVLSHELRTPLTPVLATISMLQEEMSHDRETHDNFEVMRRNIELEARLIDDLLDLTRIARGKIELNKRRVDLATVIARAVEVCKPDIEARELHFGIEVAPEAPYWVEADVARLQQVFWNLIKNAIKFTPHGGSVGIRCGPDVPGMVTAEVTDSGEGIEPEALDRIFDAFEQAEQSHARQFGGLGLGLAISRALVDLHGGRIEAHSAGKGKGASFRVILPLAPRPHGAGEGGPLPTEGREGPPLRILLVEDHGDTAQIWKRLLERRGHEVLTAGDVATALQIGLSEPLDLVISDLGLPDASGLELMQQLHSRRPDLKGIALSGYGMESDVERSHEAGFSEHLTKPVDTQTLQAAIARVAQFS